MDERRKWIKQTRKGNGKSKKRVKDGEMNGQGREKEGRGAPAPHGASEMTHHHYCYSPPQTQQCYTFDAFINLHSKNHCEQYDHWFTDA